MSMEKKVLYSNQFGSYGDRLRQKLVNRLARESKNLAKSDLEDLLPLNEVDTETNDEKNFESYSLIWCDPNVNSHANLKETQMKLRYSINFLKTFTATDDCMTYIKRRTDEKLILVVSSLFIEELLTQVHNLTQVKAVYTYASDKDVSKTLTKQFHKVNAVVGQPKDLVLSIASDQQSRVKDDKQEEISMSIFNSLTLHSSSERSHQYLDNEFMWFQLIIEILLRMTAGTLQLGFKKLITMCRKHYDTNESHLLIIKELEEMYNSKNAIWWYSRETFIFRILNRALRRQDIDILVMFAFLIQDIYQQLKELQCCHSQIIYAYRGQLLPVSELERLKNNIGKYISMNSFFSTSRCRRLAKSYAKTYNTNTTKTSVLFEIEADSTLFSAKPFADITRISAFGDTEQEILFMLGSIFKIVSIERIDDEKLWSLKFVLSSDGESEMKPTFESMKTRLDNQTTVLSLGNLFYEMGRPNTAEKYYRKLVNVLRKDDRNLPRVYGGLGNVALSNYDYQRAELYYIKALELELQSPAISQLNIAYTYINLGNTFRQTFNYEKALEYFNKSLELTSKIFGYDHIEIAKIYEQIGRVYQDQKKYNLALDAYNESLRMKRKVLPINHLEIAVLLATLGTVQEDIGDLESAFSNYKAGLSIQLICLPISPQTARMYEAIGKFNEMKLLNDNKALQHYEKALEILRHPSLAPNHPNIAAVLQRIGNIYMKRKDYELSKIKYEEALSIQMVNTADHINTAAVYNSIGALHLFVNKNCDEALTIFNKALRIYKNTLLPLNDTEMIRTQVNIAKTYYLMGKLDDAKVYLEETLKNLEENDPRIIEFYNQMGEIALEKRDYDTAYLYFKEALGMLPISSADQLSLNADTYKNLGVVLMHKQSYDKAYGYLSKALDLKLKTVGHKNRSTADIYFCIGNLFMKQEQYVQALSKYTECFQIQNEILDENDFEKMITLRNIGLAHHAMKNFESAVSTYKTVLSIQPSTSSDHLETAKTYIALGKLYLDAYSNISEALSYYQKALKIYENSVSSSNSAEYIKLLNSIRSGYTLLAITAHQSNDHGKAHFYFVKALEYEQKKPSVVVDLKIVAELLKNIATVLSIQGKYDTALEAYFKALEFHLKTFGRDYLQTAIIYENIAFIQDLQRNYDVALTNSYACLEIRQKLLPTNHKDTAKVMIQIGLVYQNTKNYELAINNFKKALSIQLASIPNDLETAKTYNRIGCIYLDYIPNYSEALFHLHEALKLCENNQLLLNHPEVISIRHNIRLAYTKLGNEAFTKNDYDNSIMYFKKAIEFQDEYIEKNVASISQMYNFIACALLNKFDYHSALEFYQKALHLKLATTGNYDQLVGDIYLNVGIIHYTLENYEAAITNLDQFLEIHRILFGENHSIIPIILTTVGAAYYKRKEYELSLINHQHALKIRIECLSEDYLGTALSYMNIGEVNEIGFENYIEALENYEKALPIYQNLSLPPDDSRLIATIDSIQRMKEKIKSE